MPARSCTSRSQRWHGCGSAGIVVNRLETGTARVSFKAVTPEAVYSLSIARAMEVMQCCACDAEQDRHKLRSRSADGNVYAHDVSWSLRLLRIQLKFPKEATEASVLPESMAEKGRAMNHGPGTPCPALSGRGEQAQAAKQFGNPA